MQKDEARETVDGATKAAGIPPEVLADAERIVDHLMTCGLRLLEDPIRQTPALTPVFDAVAALPRAVLVQTKNRGYVAPDRALAYPRLVCVPGDRMRRSEEVQEEVFREFECKNGTWYK